MMLTKFDELLDVGRSGGLPRLQLTVMGEFVTDAWSGRLATLVMQGASRSGSGFGEISVLLQKSRQADPTKCAQRSLQAMVTGSLDLDTAGHLWLVGATARTATNEVGAYTRWCTEQARLAGVPACTPRVATNPGQILEALRATGKKPSLLWLGNENIQAYADAHGDDPELRSAFTIGNANLHGPNAITQIVDTLSAVSAGQHDLVVIARGGGDRVDLSIFDDHQVLQAIRVCPVPTVVAVGHRRDHTLAEHVATWALATPSVVYQATWAAVHQKASYQEQRAAAQRSFESLKAQFCVAQQQAETDQERLQATQRLLDQVTAERDQHARFAVMERGRHADAMVQLARDDARTRIAAMDHLLAGFVAVAAVLSAVLDLTSASSSAQDAWLHQLLPATALALTAMLLWFNPRRLGRPTWGRPRPPTPVPATQYLWYQGVRTVDDYNRIDAHLRNTASRHDRAKPRITRARARIQRRSRSR